LARGEKYTAANERKCDLIGVPRDEAHGAVPEKGESLFCGPVGNVICIGQKVEYHANFAAIGCVKW